MSIPGGVPAAGRIRAGHARARARTPETSTSRLGVISPFSATAPSWGNLPGACTDSDLGIDRSEAGTLAQGAGHEISVVAAMAPDEVSSVLAQPPRGRPSEADGPSGSCVFIDNEDDRSLRDPFVSIANR